MVNSQRLELWIRLDGAHITTEALTELKNHVHEPRESNCWCM